MKTAAADRWMHKFELLGEGGIRIEILKSVEGDAESNWPPSPPLQEINRHDLGNGAALLGVGMAGKSHWSSSISADSEIIVADLACLVKGESNNSRNRWLGSTYQFESAINVEIQTQQEIELTTNEADSIRICLRSKMVGDIEPVIAVDETTIQVLNDDSQNSPIAGQNRWCFEFFLRTLA